MSLFGDTEIYESEDLLNENIVDSNVAIQLSNNEEQVEKDNDVDGDGNNGDFFIFIYLKKKIKKSVNSN